MFALQCVIHSTAIRSTADHTVTQEPIVSAELGELDSLAALIASACGPEPPRMDNRWLQSLTTGAATPQRNAAISLESLYTPQQTSQGLPAPTLNLSGLVNGTQRSQDIYGLVRNQAAPSPRAAAAADTSDPQSPTQMLLSLLGLAMQPNSAPAPSPRLPVEPAPSQAGLTLPSFDQSGLSALLAQATPRGLPTPRTTNFNYTPRGHGADASQILADCAPPFLLHV